MQSKVIVEITGKVTKTKSLTRYLEIPLDCEPSEMIRMAETTANIWWENQSGVAPESVRAVVIRPLVWGNDDASV
jgi:hypothetical protein